MVVFVNSFIATLLSSGGIIYCMAYEDESDPRYYRVTLTSGESAIFIDTNNRPNYPRLLASGIYSIVPKDGSDFLPIDADNIATIEEVDSDTDTSAS